MRLFCVLSLLAAGQVRAQPASASDSVEVPRRAEALPAIEVRAKAWDADQTGQEPAQFLSGERLSRRASSTLGATLQDELGVANASFGPNVGLPVIRGLSGPRVRTLLGGVGTNDASSISADHAVMAEPLLAESITVWRGPAAIRFGSGAIGGAVEMEDGRIPMTLPRRTQWRGNLRAGIDGSVAVAKLDGRLGEQVAWHVDAHGRRQQTTRVPGWAQDAEAIRRQFALAPTRNAWGRIPNTDAQTDGGALGASWQGNSGWLGLAVSTLRQDYGIPPGAHSHSHTGDASAPGDERVRIAAHQQRLDLRGEFELDGGVFSLLKLRAAHTDYSHDEVETGQVSTTFVNRVGELRAEAEHKLGDKLLPAGWGEASGSIGLQLTDRLFSALGREAFAPRTHVNQAALFALQNWRDGAWSLETGVRAEYQSSRPQQYRLARDGGDVFKQPPQRRLRPGSWSASLERKVGNGHVALTRWMVSRAPDVQELYADGPHLATRTYDLGRESMGVETLRGWDIGMRQVVGDFTLDAHVFRYASGNYIYQRSTGRYYNTESGGVRFECARLDLCLPVTQYEQAPARLHGYEIEIARPWTLSLGDAGEQQDDKTGRHTVRGTVALTSDTVRGRLVGGADLPRLPPLRVGLRVEAAWQGYSGELRAMRALAQKRPGENETATDGWFQLHGSLRHTQRLSRDQHVSWFALARNLTNQPVRNSTSFLRNYAPEPGRSLQLGVEFTL